MTVKSEEKTSAKPKSARNSKGLIALLLVVLAAFGASYFIKDKDGTPIITTFLENTKSSFNSGDGNVTPKSNSPAEKQSLLGNETGKPSEAPTSQQDAPAAKQSDSANVQENNSTSQNDTQIAALPETSKGSEKPSIAPTEKQQTIAEPPIPTFDVLRAEKDGSIVIAGKGPANSWIEIVEGKAVHGKARSDATGSFAIIFDKPLAQGDHELIIRAMPDTGEPVYSAEAGLVSVPQPGGELLAMVSKPGEASRVLQKPDALSETQIAALPKQPDQAMPSQDQQITSKASESIALEPKAETEQAPVLKPQEEIPVLVGAIDVEPEVVYIAGTGEPGKTVSIYIDNVFEGRVKIGAQGAFLFSKIEKLQRGRHAVRVDMLADKTGEVISRAEVVLEHEVELLAGTEPVAKPVDPTELAALPAKPVESTIPTVSAPSSVAQAPAQAPPAAPEKTQGSSKKMEFGALIQAAPKTPPQVQTAITPSVQPKPVEQTAKNASGTDKSDESIVAKVDMAKKQIPVIQSGRSVIIRRGDSLWRVSRRMLGLGRKYTTIYAANKDQIRNPHLIFPGQVLAIPDEKTN